MYRSSYFFISLLRRIKESLLVHTTILFMLSGAAHGGAIEYAGYARSIDSDIVVGDGLNWLPWDLAVDVPLDEMYSIDSDWRFADTSEIKRLFINFFGDTYEVYDHHWHYEDLPYEAVDKFIKIFGDTWKASEYSDDSQNMRESLANYNVEEASIAQLMFSRITVLGVPA